MPQRDYILRLIEQIGAALIELRKAIFGGASRDQDVEDILRRSASGAGMDLDLARAAAAEALPAMIAPTGEVDPLRCWVLAELFLTDGAHQMTLGDTEAARVALSKAGTLFKLLGPDVHIADYPEAAVRLAEIEALLEEL